MVSVIRRTGNPAREIRYAAKPCALGSVLVALSEKGICAILFGDAPEALFDDLRMRFPQALLNEAGQDLTALTQRIVAFVENPLRRV